MNFPRPAPGGPRERLTPLLSLNTQPQNQDRPLDLQHHLPLSRSGYNSHSNSNNATHSPSSTSLFSNAPSIFLKTPKPPKGKRVDAPHVTVDVGRRVSGNNGDGDQSTIRPEVTYSPQEGPRRPAEIPMGNMIGVVPPVYPSAPREDPIQTLRQAVSNISIGYSANSNQSGSMTHSPEGSSKSSPGSSATGGHGYHGLPEPGKPKEFNDEVFEVISRLGEGAGGAVHHVRDTRDGSIYARKTITTREVSTRQVVRELKIIATTSHVNIVQCFGAYMSPSSSEVKIIMEYCDGQSLEAIGKKLKERSAIIGEKIAGRIAEGILQGLTYLHSRRTIHRDIKPSNILLSREGIVKLCDFGVSGELTNESFLGTFTGTLVYMAPERVSGGEYTIRADVWSAGISLLELVQNRFPFPAELSTIELILTITNSEPPSLEDDPEADITWSDEMKDFIRQTLIREPRSRPTPREMLDHPWIRIVMNQEDHMAKWIRQVWGWPKPSKRPRKGSSRYENNGEDDGGNMSKHSTGSSVSPAD
ncbi:MAP kinase kinase skh1/pek1 [Psilocybe cubensis]|uniref:mitogen-activated protein kinase kinase n=2 Tax=Psilocybe cubensis TaxID=181762 RepID=A0A8H7XST0_PSICU|nr:MAP kinase kinase skh1/pek1 [Psilocybe cubensis]KAH9479134.1 MAP kinase kinase skh1/pek1 [Psilocybe cubensis]